jgi:hypothetical protein
MFTAVVADIFDGTSILSPKEHPDQQLCHCFQLNTEGSLPTRYYYHHCPLHHHHQHQTSKVVSCIGISMYCTDKSRKFVSYFKFAAGPEMGTM